jgi:hypothetical protein
VITLGLFVAAIAAYVTSAGPGYAGALFLLGMLLEGAGWYRMLSAKKQPPPTSHQ